jgi:uncharacterized membrane protein
MLGGHSVGHSKQNIRVHVCKYMCASTCVLFRTVSVIELVDCTIPELLIRKRHYVLFLIPVFIVQMMKLVQFT